MAAAASSSIGAADRRRRLEPTSLAVAVLGGAAAALVAQVLTRLGPAHDPTVPSHFGSEPQLLGPGLTASRVPVEFGGARLEATVLVAPAAAAAAGEATGGGGDRPLVLLLHGFPDDAASFHGQVGPLTAAGYDVVVPVLPGYEPATAGLGAGAYALPSVADALGQVAEWAMRERGKKRVHIVGHDWGAVLAYQLGTKGGRLEGRVASLVTMAVPHNAVQGIIQYPWQIYNSWYMLFFQLPLLPELWFRGASYFGLRKLWRDWSPGLTPDARAFGSLKTTFAEPGVLKSAIQYYRTNVPGMLKLMLAHKLGRLGGGRTQEVPAPVIRAPTLALSGLEDGCIATVIYDLTMGGDGDRGDEAARHDHPLFPAGVQVAKLAQAGHFMHQDRPEEVNRLILDWFGRHEGS